MSLRTALLAVSKPQRNLAGQKPHLLCADDVNMQTGTQPHFQMFNLPQNKLANQE